MESVQNLNEIDEFDYSNHYNNGRNNITYSQLSYFKKIITKYYKGNLNIFDDGVTTQVSFYLGKMIFIQIFSNINDEWFVGISLYSNKDNKYDINYLYYELKSYMSFEDLFSIDTFNKHILEYTDYSSFSQEDIEFYINQALENRNFELVEKLSKFLQ